MDPSGLIVVVGSLNLDLVVQVDRLPTPGETVHGRSIASLPGGKGANQAVAAGRLGAPVAMIGRLGDDAAAEQLRAALRRDGVDDAAVIGSAGPSGTAFIHTDGAGQNTITVVAGANALLMPADLDAHAKCIASASIVLTQLEIPLQTVQHLAHLCGAHRVPLMLDPAPAQRLPPELLAAVAWLTPNEPEAEMLCGTHATDDEATFAQLRSLGCRGILLTQGSRGVLIADTGDRAVRSSPFPVKPVDTTAAGDCFNAAFAVALRSGDSVGKAARFANAAAALSTTRHGAQPSLPTLAEVQAMLLG